MRSRETRLLRQKPAASFKCSPQTQFSTRIRRVMRAGRLLYAASDVQRRQWSGLRGASLSAACEDVHERATRRGQRAAASRDLGETLPRPERKPSRRTSVVSRRESIGPRRGESGSDPDWAPAEDAGGEERGGTPFKKRRRPVGRVQCLCTRRSWETSLATRARTRSDLCSSCAPPPPPADDRSASTRKKRKWVSGAHREGTGWSERGQADERQ